MESTQQLSPIGIDLGGKFTGVCLTHLETCEEIPNHSNTQYSVILMDQNNLQLSQEPRRTTRHRIRNKKRNQFVKRVALQLIQHLISREINVNEETAIRHYLNNRGYTYLDMDLDEYLKDESTINLLKQLTGHTSESTFIDRFLQKMEYFEFRNELQSKIAQLLPNKESKQTINNIKNFIIGFEKNSVEGHRTRKQYFQNIKSDIENDYRLDDIKKILPTEHLSNIMGHLSNLQWKNLHRYLAKEKNQFNGTAFFNEFIRMLKGFRHYKGSREAIVIHELIHQFETSQPNEHLNLLKNTSPELTIPPYEARTNTGMEKDQTLLLNPDALNRLYPNWRSLIPGIINAHPFLDQSLDHLKFRDRKRLLDSSCQEEKRDAYILHRYLDINKKLDQFKIKNQLSFLCHGKQLPTNLFQIHQQMIQHFTPPLSKTLIEISRAYSKEREDAAQGIWFENIHNLCELSYLNPPRKQKVLPLLVGAVLGENFINNQQKWIKFKLFWDSHKIGRTLLKSKCKEIEENRKKTGNLFKIKYEESLHRPDKTSDTNLASIIKTIPDIVHALKTALGHDEQQSSIYNNPFSLAQLYTILETKRDGFHKNCVAVTCENYWRTQKTNENPELAYASRLPADSARPFDGILTRMLQRLAYEISTLKWEQIKNIPNNTNLILPIYIEQNRFEFEQSLKRIKGSIDKSLESTIANQNTHWEEKYQRIINASNDICPYTGLSIGEQGEIDHIYSRSLSKKHFGMVFNSEANLIYCSSQGNHKKQEQHYLLEHLSPTYLKHQFGTEHINEIKEFIYHNVSSIKEFISFHLLSHDQQKAARHALFLDTEDELFKVITRFLMTQQKTLVNGTQKFLGKKIIELLGNKAESKNLKLECSIKQIRSEEVYNYRKSLSQLDSCFKKRTEQPFPSHVVDATITMGLGLNEYPQFHHELDKYWFIQHLIPNEIHLNQIQSKEKYNKTKINSRELFKESIYAEHFIPVWFKGDQTAIGFSEKSLFEIKPSNKEKLFALIKKYSTKNPGDSLLELQNSSKSKWAYFPINKTLALEFLHTYFHKDIVSPDDTDALNFINTLRYYTIKKPFTIKILKDPIPDLSVNFKSTKGDVLGSFTHKIILPAAKDWENLYKHPRFLSLKENPDQKEFNLFMRMYFLSGTNPSSENKHNKDTLTLQKHNTVRKVFSLPIVPGNAGTMMRIRRKNNKGAPLYQLQTIAGTPSKGIRINNGKLINQEILMNAYKTKNVSTINGINDSNIQHYAPFNYWLMLPLAGSKLDTKIIKLEMKPHSKTRRYIRITQSLTHFAQTMTDALIIKPDYLNLDDPLNMPNEIVCKNKLFDSELSPRDGKIKITATGQYVTYEFESNSTPSWIQQIYVTELKKKS